jgi:hypothetical protein
MLTDDSLSSVASMNGPRMFGIQVPVVADPVAAPTVTYGEELTFIEFLTIHAEWARVTFEHLDSICVSRGEYAPYPSDWQPGDQINWVSEVLPSPWLLERFEYEKTHYAQAYEFNGDVNEMLRDFAHYIFRFHDQFVEALSSGIWLERLHESSDSENVSATHPLRNLPRPIKPDLIEAYGMLCEIWPNPRPIDRILEDAKLCSQKLLQFALVLDSDPNISWTLAVRVRHGKVRSSLRPRIGPVRATFEGVARLEHVRPYVESWLQEVMERRKRMGRA